MTPLDCGDNSCRSPERGRGGMRTNGGCRCGIENVAQAHERIAAKLRGSPSAKQEARDEERAFEYGKRVAFDAFVARCLKGGPSWTATLCDVARFMLEQEGRPTTSDAVNAKVREMGWKP